MPKRIITGTLTLQGVPFSMEIDDGEIPPTPIPGPEPGSQSWVHDILGTSVPTLGVDGPRLTREARAGAFDEPESLRDDLPERDDLQAQLDAATSVCKLEPGIYRCGAVIDRPLEVHGGQQVSIRGSDNWSVGPMLWWQEGEAWCSGGSVPDWQPEPLEAFQATDIWRASRPWVVMVDGQRYYIEPGEDGTPSPGHFRLNPQRHVLLPIDPHEHRIEVTTRTSWLNVQADDVVLMGMDFRHAPSGLARWNPLESNGQRISFIESMFGWCHAYGPAPGGSAGSLSQACIYHNSGVGGLCAPGMEELEFRDAALFNNGWGEGWDRYNGSGGFKDVSSAGTLMENNAAWNNAFSGLWVDIDCRGSRFRSNVLWDNGGNQMHYEISQGGLIEDNVFFRTDEFTSPTERTLGLYISSSRAARVRNNLSMHLPSCYEVRWTDRDDMPPGGCNRILLEDNISIGRTRPADQASQWGSDFGLVWVDSAQGALVSDASNLARNHRYGYAGPEPEYRWAYLEEWLTTLAEVQATPQIGAGASYLQDAERLAMLSRFGLRDE